jgi:hypothetical protein
MGSITLRFMKVLNSVSSVFNTSREATALIVALILNSISSAIVCGWRELPLVFV